MSIGLNPKNFNEALMPCSCWRQFTLSGVIGLALLNQAQRAEIKVFPSQGDITSSRCYE
jgi:hypothetical protein